MAEERVEEAEILASIFEDKFTAEGPPEAPSAFVFQLEPRVEDEEAAVRVRATLRLELPAEYPTSLSEDAVPAASVPSSRGLSDAELDKVVRVAKETAVENVGMQACFTVVDAVVELLTDFNASASVCSICCQSVTPDKPSFTAACMHTYHQRCLCPWIQCAEKALAASIEKDASESRSGRGLSAAKGALQDKVNLEAAAVRSVDELTAMVARAETDLEALVATEDVEDSDIKAAEAALTALRVKLKGAGGKLEAASATRAAFETKAADCQATWDEECSRRVPDTPCPDCRASIPFGAVEAFYVPWRTRRQATGREVGSAAFTPAAMDKSKQLLSALPSSSKSYLTRFRKQLAEILARQGKCGGLIVEGSPVAGAGEALSL